MDSEKLRVKAQPTKRYFMSMITKDIDYKAAILELVDNSIDGAKRMGAKDDFSNFFINLYINNELFYIEDNCGGISVKNASEYAFCFGRPDEEEQKYVFETGTYGIGMKRALFKMGRIFEIKSLTEISAFTIDINLDDWERKKEDWNFDFSSLDESVRNRKDQCGTSIKITNLCQGVKELFSIEANITSIKSYIEDHCSEYGNYGLKIRINDVELNFGEHEIIKAANVQPFERLIKKDGVETKIIAGIVKKGNPEEAGWYIYCNGRMIIQADKSTLTGWGEESLPVYHPKFAIFRGFVYFESPDPSKLPWNTTKTNVDTSSELYLLVKTKMRDAISQINKWINLINSSGSLIITNDGEDEEEPRYINQNADEIFSIKPVALTTSVIKSMANTDKDFNIVLTIAPKIPFTTISYKRPKSEVGEVKKVLNVSSNYDVGLKTYQYFLKREVGKNVE